MDTRLKNAEETKEHNWFVRFLLSRKKRAVAFSVACILTAVTYLLGMKWFDMLEGSQYMYEGRDILFKDYTESRQFRKDKLDIYEALCITSSFYLRNVDEKGEFILSESAFLDYVQTMKNNYGLNIKKDKNGKIYADNDKWEFYVAFDDKYLTNMDYDFSKFSMDLLDMEEDIQQNYSNYFIRKANNFSTDLVMSDEDYNWITYSDVLSYKGYEEYDANLLPLGASGYDNLGRFIFQYYGDEEVVFFEPSLKDKKFSQLSDFEIKHEMFCIEESSEEGVYLRTTEDEAVFGYSFTEYSDASVSLFFAPKSDYFTNMAKDFAGFKGQYKAILPCFIASALLWICSCGSMWI